jgi:hypothetical protein
MIKRFNQFIKESNVSDPPGPNMENTNSFLLTDVESSMFRKNPILSNLISDQKVSLIDNTLYYYKDNDVIQLLSQFFPNID